jgi:NADPH-dependent 2,4-dienoyl-CoA reductase/sulfur reductase-like enzyme
MPEDSDKEVHRYQHGFPEDVEENKVESAENANQPCLQHKKEDHELFESRLRSARVAHAQYHQEGGQEDKQEANAVYAHLIADVHIAYANPTPIFDILNVPPDSLHIRGEARVELQEHPQREQERQNSEQHGDHADSVSSRVFHRFGGFFLAVFMRVRPVPMVVGQVLRALHKEQNYCAYERKKS